jgi:hypothetical protein
VIAWFGGPSFDTAVTDPKDVRGTEAVVACAKCLSLIEENDREGLARRSAANEARRQGRLADAGHIAQTRQRHDQMFWIPRSASGR